MQEILFWLNERYKPQNTSTNKMLVFYKKKEMTDKKRRNVKTNFLLPSLQCFIFILILNKDSIYYKLKCDLLAIAVVN